MSFGELGIIKAVEQVHKWRRVVAEVDKRIEILKKWKADEKNVTAIADQEEKKKKLLERVWKAEEKVRILQEGFDAQMMRLKRKMEPIKTELEILQDLKKKLF